MVRDSAEVRGRAMVRPFRVAPVVDINSNSDVRAAIRDLSLVWGGFYTPIFDANQTADEIERQARVFDVDALHVEDEGALRDELSSKGWLWGGRGSHGPFARSPEGFRTGLLPTSALALDGPSLLLPEWDADDPLDMFYTTVFGTSMSDLASESDSGRGPSDTPLASVGLGYALVRPDVTLDDIGLIQTTRIGLTTQARHYLDSLSGAFIVRAGNAQDLLTYWNLRVLGRPVLALPDQGPSELLRLLTRGSLPGNRWPSVPRTSERSRNAEASLDVWNLDFASEATRGALEQMAERLGMVVRQHLPFSDAWIGFPGLDTRFKTSIRAEFPATAQVVTVRVPRVPLVPTAHQVMPGTIAVEIDVDDVIGLDPRTTATLPPMRRFGTLFQRRGMSQADHVRVAADGGGLVVGVPATYDEVPIGFAFHLDAIRTLFDDPDLKVSQSDDGRFQTRAAEMLGGPFGGVMVQPGVRAVIEKAGRSAGGLTLQQLRAEVKKNHGVWPDPVWSWSTRVDDYVESAVNGLLLSGLFVPMLDVHCSHCRVDSQVAPRDLDSQIRCEFCGETFRLALSLALSRSKSRWRYQLAAHLGSEKVKALLPALATSSLLGHLANGGGALGAHAFGVEFNFADRKRLEADFVAYLTSPDWSVVIAEVKNSNWIDVNDIGNLEDLQHRLDEKKVRSILAFATLKERLAPQEVAALRNLVERARTVTTAHGVVTPRLPLVLTVNELSLPWGHDAHPVRWTQPGRGDGIFSTAIESCKRNLGLVEIRPMGTGDDRAFACSWQEPPSKAKL